MDVACKEDPSLNGLEVDKSIDHVCTFNVSSTSFTDTFKITNAENWVCEDNQRIFGCKNLYDHAVST